MSTPPVFPAINRWAILNRPYGTATRGMTLVELLVVLSIILMVAAVTIPRLRPEMDRSRVREAARSIQTYLSTARNLAMATGRSCGVMIERLPAENGCSMTLSQVETPVRYGGDTIGATATVTQAQPPSGALPGYAYCSITISPPPSVPLFRLDQIQIGYQGFWITLDNSNAVNAASVISNPGTLIGYVDTSHGENPAWTNSSATINGPFSIKRWPTKSQASPLQLPTPACIDLMWSGVDPNPLATADTPVWMAPASPTTSTPPVTIMFAPNGSVDKIYVTLPSTGNSVTYHESRVTSTIYLLVGRRDEVVDPPNPASAVTTNLNDFTNLWVAINASTGLIVVADLATTGTNVSVPANNAAYYSNSVLWQSRAFARQASANGGK